MAFWVAVTWLPLAVWAVLSGRAFGGEVAEPLLVHFTVHARLLLGVLALEIPIKELLGAVAKALM